MEPYMNLPEADALKNMVKPAQVEGPERPSLELGVAPTWFSLGNILSGAKVFP